MVAQDGWHSLFVPGTGAGARYRFRLPDGVMVPDPASRFQPDGVDGPSEVAPPMTAGAPGSWSGRPWREAVLYEFHVGTFTPEGTYRAAMTRLVELADLGITAIELMPLAAFAGERGWGYDGVYPFAPHAPYGRPEDLRAFVDVAHDAGLMVVLDVVYNHFGPSGNHLGRYAPDFFSERHCSAWGAGLNFDGPGSEHVRRFFIENALYWLNEFRFDGLRLDAIHAIADHSGPSFLDELSREVRKGAKRPVHLVVENEANAAGRLTAEGGYDAQWNDDLHHCLHVAATGESSGYYASFANRTDLLGRCLAEGFAFQGESMDGAARGSDSRQLPSTAFVGFVQNHDQTGNRAFGERVADLMDERRHRAIAAVLLLAPQIPLLFMGQEWNATAPFPFLCDFDEERADKVREGRMTEFAHFEAFRDPAMRRRIPDPQSEDTFRSAKLDWGEAERNQHWRDWYRRALAARREHILPLLGRFSGAAARYEVVREGTVLVEWTAGATTLLFHANLAEDAIAMLTPPQPIEFWSEAAGAAPVMGPWSVRWSKSDGGPRLSQ